MRGGYGFLTVGVEGEGRAWGLAVDVESEGGQWVYIWTWRLGMGRAGGYLWTWKVRGRKGQGPSC